MQSSTMMHLKILNKYLASLIDKELARLVIIIIRQVSHYHNTLLNSCSSLSGHKLNTTWTTQQLNLQAPSSAVRPKMEVILQTSIDGIYKSTM